MDILLPIMILLLIASISRIIVRFGARALQISGLSWDVSIFQAQSAFFGAGFTTSESELVLSNPARRNTIRYLIVAGNINFTGALGALVVTFVHSQAPGDTLWSILLIILGLLAVARLGRLDKVQEATDALISRGLRRAGIVRTVDYSLLLKVKAGFCVSQITIDSRHQHCGRSLAEAKLSSDGWIVLGITRADGTYVGAPQGTSIIETGDTITVYGQDTNLHKLSSQPKPSQQAPSA